VSARDPGLRVLETVQDIIHCPMVVSNDVVMVPMRLYREMQDAYADWLAAHRNSPECEIEQARRLAGSVQ
jgi:hypothetical protein